MSKSTELEEQRAKWCPTGPPVNHQSLKIHALQETALKLWEVDQVSALQLGRALIAVRDVMTEHGEFAEWFHKAGMEENRVYYCIRKAEGKVKNETAAPTFLLNHRNLAVAKIAPEHEGRFVGGTSIHVGKNGTTASDGLVVVRVSLPPDSPVPEGEGLIPAEMVPQLAAGNTAAVSFGKTSTTIRESRELPTHSKKGGLCTGKMSTATRTTTNSFPPDTTEFPPADNVLGSRPETLSQFTIQLHTLLKLLSAAKDFDSGGFIVLTFTDYQLLGDMVAENGQTWHGRAMKCK